MLKFVNIRIGQISENIDFISDYERRGKSKTAETYRKLLRQFEEWLKTQGNSGKFEREDVIEFLDSKGWANSSKNVFITALHGWASAELEKVEPPVTDGEKLEARRLKRIKGIKTYDSKPNEREALTLDQIIDLRTIMDDDTGVLFWILLWFGLRVGELRRIKEIDWEDGSLTVETLKRKGRRIERTLYFDDYTERLLRYAERKGLLQMNYQAIYKRFVRASRALSVKLTPHVCRHMFATHFAQRTDPYTLKTLLGHSAGMGESSGDVTSLYVHPFAERIRELMTEKHYLAPLEVG